MNTSDVSLVPTNVESSTITAYDDDIEIANITTTQFINNNGSTQDTVTIINSLSDHLGSDITDDINRIDNDHISTTLPTIDIDNILTTLPNVENDYISTTLPNVDNDYISTIIPTVINNNDTEYNSKIDNINTILNNSSEIITEITGTLQSVGNFSLNGNINDISSDNVNKSIFLDTIDNDYILTTLPTVDNEYISTTIITDITDTPQSVGNFSLNGNINNILNTTVNNDQFSIFSNPLTSTTTKDLLINITEEFNYSNNETVEFTIEKSLPNNFTSEIVQNISYIDKSSYEDTVSVTHWIDEGATVEDLLFVSYHVVFPILICLALIFNCFALYVFRKPKLVTLSENRYLQFISGVNILCALNAIPATILKNHCPFTSLSSAYYYTYFSWTTVFLLRNLSICSLVWMSYDRFLYIWSLSLLQKVMQPAVVKKRLISTTIIIIIAFVPLICLGKVRKCSDVSSNCNEDYKDKWLSFSGYRRDLEDTWFAVLIIFLVQGTIHIILILLTISLFTGLKQKIFKRRKRQVDQTISLIINNISYLVLDIAYVITTIFFYKYKYDQGHCYNTFSRERLMATINCLLMFWASFSTLIFLFQSKVYRNQVISTLFFTSDRDEKVRNSVRQSIQLQQRQSIQLQQMKQNIQLQHRQNIQLPQRQSIQLPQRQSIQLPQRRSIQLQPMKVPEVTQL